MRGPHNLFRLVRAGATFERTGAMNYALEKLEAPLSIRVALRIVGWPFKWLGLKGEPDLPPVARALTSLGPAYIKLGQNLSTRPDIVGDDFSAELKVLLDRLPPFSDQEAKRTIRKELGREVDELFSEFSPPVAAASVAQVHRARVRSSGREVAVKILRPGIERVIRRDIDAFYFTAKFIEFFLPATRRLHPTDVIRYFEQIILAEIDLRLEASAVAEHSANTSGDKGFSVPSLVWEFSARRVMTLDWIDGVPLSDPDALRRQGVDFDDLASRVVQSFLRHALRDGFFHADLHPGNLMVTPDGSLLALDYGITGRIDDYTRRVYAEILFGFIRRDYDRVARVHFEAGYVPRGQDINAFSQALRSVGEPIFGQDATRISMGRLLRHLFDVTERFGMETRTELLLLQKTMVVVEGVARSLNPNLNIWETAKPVVEQYIKDNVGPKAIVRDAARTLEILSRFGPRVPMIIEEGLNRGRDGPQQSQAPRSNSNVAVTWFSIGVIVAVSVLFLVDLI